MLRAPVEIRDRKNRRVYQVVGTQVGGNWGT